MTNSTESSPTTPDPTPPPSAKRKLQLISKPALRRLTILFAVIAIALTAFSFTCLRMPGPLHTGPLPELTQAQSDTADRLRADVEVLANDFPARSIFHARQLAGTIDYLEAQLTAAGLTPQRHTYTARSNAESAIVYADLPGTTHPHELIVIGAHYDTAHGGPGADDNASGCAAVLELARRFTAPSTPSAASTPPARTIRFALFPNEEPPFFQDDDMGALVHARQLATDHAAGGPRVVAMLSLEMLGYYSDEPHSQVYPFPLSLAYPSTGNFIAIVGNLNSLPLVRSSTKVFRETTPFPAHGASLPAGIPGVGWSDHWAFWQTDTPAVMITDTAHFRNPNYHTPSDTPDSLNYHHMARVTEGIEQVITHLATPNPN